jgi:hypothetical protein
VRLGRVLHHQDRYGSDVHPELRGGALRIGDEPFAKAVVDPRPGHELGAPRRAEGFHVLDLGPHLVGGEDPFLDEEAGHRHLHQLMAGEGSVFKVGLGRMVVGRVHVVAGVVVVVTVFVSAPVFMVAHMVAHLVSPGSGASQCS